MNELSPWRVEWFRLTRTRRVIALLGVFVFLGFAEPVGAYYLPRLLRHAGSRITINAPAAVPADGIGGYASNALLIGLIVLVVVTASACALDARPALSAFYRTRAGAYWRLLLPRVAVAGGSGIGAFLLGLGCAWYETGVLIGAPSAAAMAEAAGLVSVYLAFAAAVTALAGTLARSTVAATAWALATLLGCAIAGVIPQITNWLPSALTGAPDALVRQTATGGHYLPAVFVTAVATGGLILAAAMLGRRREVS